MTVNELIKILDKKENKYGGLTGKERELYISINGEFLGSIENAKLNGWGDGLITDVTLELQCEKEIRSKTIDEFANWMLERHSTDLSEYITWYQDEFEERNDKDGTENTSLGKDKFNN